jgi:NADPH:quinone reductase
MPKAILCRDYGSIDALDYAEVETPAPQAGEIVLKTEAVGVNFPDGLLVKGLYQMRPTTPFVPGMEAVGTVRAVGPHIDDLKPGDRVAVLLQTGGYAEEIVTDARNAFALPQGMDSGEACALLCAYGTAHHALKQRAALQPGETLAVLGAAGSTGIAAIQIGKAMGAKVIAVASSVEKRERATSSGADMVFGYENLKSDLKEATGGRGADVVFDPVGGDAFDAASRAMARGGRLLVIGFASGRIPQFPVNLALVKEYSLVGVFWGAFTTTERGVYADNMRELFDWYARGLVKPFIEGHYPLREAPRILSRVLDRGAIGKIVLVP